MKGDTDAFPVSWRFLLGRLRHAMTGREKELVESSLQETRIVGDGAVLLKRGAVCDHATLLVEGFAARCIYKEGKRYIVGIQVPGDFMDLHAFALKRLDHDLVTIGPAKVGIVSHDRLRDLLQSEPHLARLFWFSTLLDAAIHRQWTLKLGQLRASRLVAHLLAEMWARLDQVGLATPAGFRTPLTQMDLADMCGTTPIHMNRSISELRRANIVDVRRGKVSCPDRARLEAYGDFNPAYLYGEGELHVGSALDRH